MQHQPVSPTLLRKPTFPFIDVLSRYTHTTTFKTTSGESRSKARPFRSRHLTRARQANKTAAFLSTTAPRNNRYHYHSARRRTIWTGSHGQLQGRAWYRQLKFMRKSLTFVHGRRVEGDVTPTARFIISGEEGTRSSYF